MRKWRTLTSGKTKTARLPLFLCPEVLDEPLSMGRQSCQAADTDCQTTRRPGIDERDDPDCRRLLVPAGCRFRNYSQTNSAPNHSANGIEAGKSDTQSQATAGAVSVVFHLILKGATSGKANMVIGKGIAKRDLPLTAHT
jgi:hypothetical protein